FISSCSAAPLHHLSVPTRRSSDLNIFDQNPEDELFPACEEMDVAVIARVPFDEGSLTGNITAVTVFPENDFRAMYFASGKHRIGDRKSTRLNSSHVAISYAVFSL